MRRWIDLDCECYARIFGPARSSRTPSPEGRASSSARCSLRNSALDDDAPAQLCKLDAARTAAIVDSRGEWLVRNGWGNYVAFIVDPLVGTTLVLNDPCGSLPCFSTGFRGITVVFSAIADCMDLGPLRFTANRRFIERRLHSGEMTQQFDALNEVTQIRRGECAEFSPLRQPAMIGRRFLWNPFDIARLQPAAGRSIPGCYRAAQYFAVVYIDSRLGARKTSCCVFPAASIRQSFLPACDASRTGRECWRTRNTLPTAQWIRDLGRASQSAIPIVSTSRSNPPLRVSGSARFWKWRRRRSRSAR
jgi:hypothetical protein